MIVKIKGYASIIASSVEAFSPTPAASVYTIDCVADVSGSLGGTYLHCFSANSATVHTLWFNVSSGNKQPNVSGLGFTTITEVSISTDDADTVVATALRAAINGLSDFAGTGATNQVIVTNAANGASSPPRDGTKSATTGFSYGLTTKGITALGSGTFLKVTGYQHDTTSVQDSGTYGPIEFNRSAVFTLIVPESSVTEIAEN